MRLRKDTVDRTRNDSLIDVFKQNLIGILGIRGAGKSYLGEAILERYFDAGYTCLDLWSAPNLENGFWIFAKEGHKKRIPITILAPESFIDPVHKVDRFNEKFITKQVLVKFVKLPTPTKKTDSEQNERILEIITDVIIECRDKRRILVFNPFMFPNETEMFRILEILMRNLISISQNHFDAIEPKDVGKEKVEEMTLHQITFHKMVFLIREFGEVAPARLKGDKSGESTLIKKALLKFVRLARHANIDGIIDYQNSSDADSAIRNQISTWLIRKWTEQLAGDNFQPIFNVINAKRKRIFEKMGYTDLAFKFADSVYPSIEKLSHFWYYVHKEGDPPRLKKVPELHIMHKEPSDKWTKLTGIPIQYDKELLKKALVSGSTSKISKIENDNLCEIMNTMITTHKGKKLKWKEVIERMSTKQEGGVFQSVIEFKTAKPDTIRKMFKTWDKKNGNAPETSQS